MHTAKVFQFPNALHALPAPTKKTVANDDDNVPFTDVVLNEVPQETVDLVPMKDYKTGFRANSKDRWRASFPCRTNPTE